MAIHSIPNSIASIDQSKNQVQPQSVQGSKVSGFWSFIRQARTTNPNLEHIHPTYWGKDAYLLELIREGACQ